MQYSKAAATIAGSVRAHGAASSPPACGARSVYSAARSPHGPDGDLGSVLQHTGPTAASGQLSGCTPMEALTGSDDNLLGVVPLSG